MPRWLAETLLVAAVACSACGGQANQNAPNQCNGLDTSGLDAGQPFDAGGSGGCPGNFASASGTYPGGQFAAGYSVFGTASGACPDSLLIVLTAQQTLPGAVSAAWPTPWLQLNVPTRVGECVSASARLYDGQSQYDATGAVILEQRDPSPAGAFAIRGDGFDLRGKFAPAHCPDLDVLCQ